jgi:hypothetical protein
MSEACQRVRLIHELAQLAGPEELLDRGHYRPDVDQSLRGDRLWVLSGHPLSHHPLQASEADANLVLDQFPDSAHPAVSEMVDVVGAIPIRSLVKLHQVADGVEDVLLGKEPHLLGPVRLPIIHVIGRPVELLVQLVAAHPSEVVALLVLEEALHELLRRVDGGQLARPQLAVEVEQRFLALDRGVALDRGADRLSSIEEGQQGVGVLREVEGPQERGHVLTTLAVDSNPYGALLVYVELEPGPATGDDLGGVHIAFGGLVDILVEVDPGRTHQLTDDHPLSPVDDERPVGGHHREVAQEDLLLLDLPGLSVHEPGGYEQGTRVGGIALFGLFDGEGRGLEAVVAQLQGKALGEVLDR